MGRSCSKANPLPKRAIKDRTKDQLRQAQMIYQMADTALNPKKKIGEIIGRPLQFYSGLKGADLKKRVDELLDEIELEPSLYYPPLPSELSGGQKQRVGIARALAADPTFIICDEVTSALDQLVAEGILRLLDKLQKEKNLAYMFITHDLATVRSIADEVVVMKEGKVVEAGAKGRRCSSRRTTNIPTCCCPRFLRWTPTG
jgi:peptide/nickel transport system ATP-binding protein